MIQAAFAERCGVLLEPTSCRLLRAPDLSQAQPNLLEQAAANID